MPSGLQTLSRNQYAPIQRKTKINPTLGPKQTVAVGKITNILEGTSFRFAMMRQKRRDHLLREPIWAKPFTCPQAYDEVGKSGSPDEAFGSASGCS